MAEEPTVPKGFWAGVRRLTMLAGVLPLIAFLGAKGGDLYDYFKAEHDDRVQLDRDVKALRADNNKIRAELEKARSELATAKDQRSQWASIYQLEEDQKQLQIVSRSAERIQRHLILPLLTEWDGEKVNWSTALKFLPWSEKDDFEPKKVPEQHLDGYIEQQKTK